MPNLKLYCITYEKSDVAYDKQVKQACLGGADIIQFRWGNLKDKRVVEIGKKIKDICKRFKVPFILNNRADLASIINADGVHLGQNDLSVKQAREILGNKKVIGVSASTVSAAIKAQKDSADYIGVGAIYSTPIKRNKSPQGTGILPKVKKAVKIPVFAIGGINAENVSCVREGGVDGVAVIRSVCGSKNIVSAAKKIKQKL
ncbi:thiamine phosphate synthase [Elusimicrobiota bacterium]